MTWDPPDVDVSPTQIAPSGAAASTHDFEVAGIFEVKSVTLPTLPSAGAHAAAAKHDVSAKARTGE